MDSQIHSYEKLEGDALHLTLQERSRLAIRLIESLDDGDDLSEERVDEVRCRAKKIDDGTATLVSDDDVMTRVRNRLSDVR